MLRSLIGIALPALLSTAQAAETVLLVESAHNRSTCIAWSSAGRAEPIELGTDNINYGIGTKRAIFASAIGNDVAVTVIDRTNGRRVCQVKSAGFLNDVMISPAPALTVDPEDKSAAGVTIEVEKGKTKQEVVLFDVNTGRRQSLSPDIAGLSNGSARLAGAFPLHAETYVSVNSVLYKLDAKTVTKIADGVSGANYLAADGAYCLTMDGKIRHFMDAHGSVIETQKDIALPPGDCSLGPAVVTSSHGVDYFIKASPGATAKTVDISRVNLSTGEVTARSAPVDATSWATANDDEMYFYGDDAHLRRYSFSKDAIVDLGEVKPLAKADGTRIALTLVSAFSE